MQPEEGKEPPASAACRRKARHESIAEALQCSPLKRAPAPRPPHPHLHLPILTDSEPGPWLQPPGHIINIITVSNSSSAVCKREPTPPAPTSPPRRSLRRAVVQQRRRGQDQATSQHQKAPLSQWDKLPLPGLTKGNQPHASWLQGYLQDAASRHELLTVLILRNIIQTLILFLIFLQLRVSFF